MISDSERAERARDFLRRVRDDQGARWAVVLATDADVEPEEVDEDYCAALHRVLVDWVVAEVNGLMRELGVKEIVVRAEHEPRPVADPMRPRGRS